MINPIQFEVFAGQTEGLRCDICLGDKAPYNSHPPVVAGAAPCAGLFHKDCLVTWVKTNVAQFKDAHCPNCRAGPIDPASLGVRPPSEFEKTIKKIAVLALPFIASLSLCLLVQTGTCALLSLGIQTLTTPSVLTSICLIDFTADLFHASSLVSLLTQKEISLKKTCQMVFSVFFGGGLVSLACVLFKRRGVALVALHITALATSFFIVFGCVAKLGEFHGKLHRRFFADSPVPLVSNMNGMLLANSCNLCCSLFLLGFVKAVLVIVPSYYLTDRIIGQIFE